MDEKMSIGITKAQFVADVLNKTLYQLVIRCKKSEGVRHYFDIGVITYGGSGVQGGFGGALGGSFLRSVIEIEGNPLRVEDRVKRVPDGAGGLVEQSTKFPVWFDPISNGGTPMCDGLRKAAEVLVGWSDQHPNSYPATIIHVTDGQSTDGDPSTIASTLQQISTQDGTTLLFNLHIDANEGASVVFPSSDAVLPDSHSRTLFKMSSPIPGHLIAPIQQKGYTVSSESRFFGYKAGYEEIVEFFEIGTRASQMR
jgi:hypothetical protein